MVTATLPLTATVPLTGWVACQNVPLTGCVTPDPSTFGRRYTALQTGLMVTYVASLVVEHGLFLRVTCPSDMGIDHPLVFYTGMLLGYAFVVGTCLWVCCLKNGSTVGGRIALMALEVGFALALPYTSPMFGGLEQLMCNIVMVLAHGFLSESYWATAIDLRFCTPLRRAALRGIASYGLGLSQLVALVFWKDWVAMSDLATRFMVSTFLVATACEFAVWRFKVTAPRAPSLEEGAQLVSVVSSRQVDFTTPPPVDASPVAT